MQRNLLYYVEDFVFIYIVPPVVAAVITNYTAFVGSSVVLACQIIYEGHPRASFRWRRHGLYVSDDHIVTNDTHTMLLLTNLTEEDYGFYRCVTDGVLTYDIHEVYLSLQGDCMHTCTVLAKYRNLNEVTCEFLWRVFMLSILDYANIYYVELLLILFREHVKSREQWVCGSIYKSF